jgi:argininosuccinate synthase
MKTVLAFSGGLDTSVCVKLLQKEYNSEVVTVTVDVGISGNELKEVEEKASTLGAKHFSVDAKDEFVSEYVFASVKANGLYEGYPLSTALARPLIAKKVVEVAKKEGADSLAHGATGKGNDQFRFESVFMTQAPDLKIIAPIREGNLTRDQSMAYAKKHGIPVGDEKPFSIDENLWGRSIEGGVLEDPSTVPPEEIFMWTVVSKNKPEIVEIAFERGVPIAFNEKKMDGVNLISRLNDVAGSQGVGRIDMVEDRILGLKAREIYECPAAVVILQAHKDLERIVLSREELKFKEFVDLKWSELVYRGLWNEPLKADLDALIEKTQERVSGVVKVELRPGGSSRLVGRSSRYSLYSEEAVSFDNTSIDQREVEGMLRYHALQASLSEKTKRK